jgi:hypothetical protein
MDVDADRYARARKRARELKGLYVHAAVYVLVNLGLFVVNMLTSRDSLWFYWPLLGWGIGLAIHAFVVGGGNFLGDEWEDKKARQLIQREDDRRSATS